MPNLTADLNTTYSWVCGGTSEVLSCPALYRHVRDGVQCEASFEMHTATVTVTLVSGITETVTVPTAHSHAALIGQYMQLSGIAITGVPAGTYTVRFSM